MLGYKKSLEGSKKLIACDEIESKYYLKLKVMDKPGVLASVASTMGKFGISIESMLQKPSKKADRVKLLFTTHICKELHLKSAIESLKKVDMVDSSITMIRIEE